MIISRQWNGVPYSWRKPHRSVKLGNPWNRPSPCSQYFTVDFNVSSMEKQYMYFSTVTYEYSPWMQIPTSYTLEKTNIALE